MQQHINLILAAILAISLVLNILLFNKGPDKKSLDENDKDLIKLQQTYPFLAKRVLIDNPNDVLINFILLRKNLKEHVKKYGDSFGFYFEYLPTGVSIGINEKLEFYPASLLKVPLVMALYHQQARTGLDLSQKVKIKKEHLDDKAGSLWQKGEGAEVSLEELARLAIVESDNTATKVLADHIAEEDYKDIYEGLDIEAPLSNSADNLVFTVKYYASILKALYFSSGLSEDNSQKILKLLTQTSFNDKLVAPLPRDIPVAHKVGEIADKLYQDCGIVYLTNRPYLLCMFSQSSEIEARNRMNQISDMVYQYIIKE